LAFGLVITFFVTTFCDELPSASVVVVTVLVTLAFPVLLVETVVSDFSLLESFFFIHPKRLPEEADLDADLAFVAFADLRIPGTLHCFL
jgi:hypothetical protein